MWKKMVSTLLKWFVFAVAFMVGFVLSLLVTHMAFATEIGKSEDRLWQLCTREVALDIGAIYRDHGYEMAYHAWDRAEALNWCHITSRSMMPLGIVFTARDLNIVEVKDEMANRLYYWVTVETLEFEDAKVDGGTIFHPRRGGSTSTGSQ